MKKIFTLLVGLLFAVTTFAQTGPDYKKFLIRSVHDGDSFVAESTDGKRYVCRILGIDAPEVRSNIILATQPYGRISGDTLRSLIKGKFILLDTTALKADSQRDKYGRLLVEPYFADSSSIALWMVQNGFAWQVDTKSRKFRKMNTILSAAHKEARDNNIGLWFGYLDEKAKKRSAIAPWTWRKKYSIFN